MEHFAYCKHLIRNFELNLGCVVEEEILYRDERAEWAVQLLEGCDMRLWRPGCTAATQSQIILPPYVQERLASRKREQGKINFTFWSGDGPTSLCSELEPTAASSRRKDK